MVPSDTIAKVGVRRTARARPDGRVAGAGQGRPRPACSPFRRTSGRNNVSRTCSKTKVSSSSARMLRSGQRRCLATGSERVVVAAVIVAMERSIASAHLVARNAHATGSTLDQPAAQPVAGFSAPGTPPRVVATDTLRRQPNGGFQAMTSPARARHRVRDFLPYPSGHRTLNAPGNAAGAPEAQLPS